MPFFSKGCNLEVNEIHRYTPAVMIKNRHPLNAGIYIACTWSMVTRSRRRIRWTRCWVCVRHPILICRVLADRGLFLCWSWIRPSTLLEQLDIAIKSKATTIDTHFSLAMGTASAFWFALVALKLRISGAANCDKKSIPNLYLFASTG